MSADAFILATAKWLPTASASHACWNATPAMSKRYFATTDTKGGSSSPTAPSPASSQPTRDLASPPIRSYYSDACPRGIPRRPPNPQSPLTSPASRMLASHPAVCNYVGGKPMRHPAASPTPSTAAVVFPTLAFDQHVHWSESVFGGLSCRSG